MTLRTWINRWWVNDPNVTPCPKCGCPLQAPPRRSMSVIIKEHFDVVHPGVAVQLVPGRPVGQRGLS